MCKKDQNSMCDKDDEIMENEVNETDDVGKVEQAETDCQEITLEQCKKQLQSLREEVDNKNNQLKRSIADYANLKSRSEKERAAIIKSSNQNMMCQLLPVIDNFQRAVNAKDEDVKSEGILMIYKQLMKVLKEEGLRRVEAIGVEFDPNIHEALFTEESQNYDDGTVLEIFEPGYIFKDKLIRAAKVKVASNKEDA